MVIAVILSIFNADDEEAAIKNQSFMLVGVMVLVEVAAQTGGLDYAVNAITAISTSNTISGVFGFITGFVSTYSGSSAVVMPVFIPLIPEYSFLSGQKHHASASTFSGSSLLLAQF